MKFEKKHETGNNEVKSKLFYIIKSCPTYEIKENFLFRAVALKTLLDYFP